MIPIYLSIYLPLFFLTHSFSVTPLPFLSGESFDGVYTSGLGVCYAGDHRVVMSYQEQRSCQSEGEPVREVGKTR